MVQWLLYNMLWSTLSGFSFALGALDSLFNNLGYVIGDLLPPFADITNANTPATSANIYIDLRPIRSTYGVTQVKAPTWLPRGCQSQTTERIYTLDQVYYQLNTTYEYQGNTMVLEISNADISQAALKTAEGTVERTEVYGQTVYILEHSDGVTVTWHSRQVACCLEGPEQEVLVRMAESMLA